MPYANISSETLVNVEKSYRRCINDPGFFDRFYDRFLGTSAEIQTMFAETDFTAQKTLLAEALAQMLLYAKDHLAGQMALKRLARRHGSDELDITPEFYQVWLHCLLAEVGETDSMADDSLLKQWREVMMVGINFLIANYRGAP